MKNKTIVYVNYSPYENVGKITDFLIENFRYVFVFSIGFHNLGVSNQKNWLLVYSNGVLLEEKPFYHMPVPRSLVFLLLPVRSILNLIQIFWIVLFLNNKYKRMDYYLSVNAYTICIGMILKKFNFVKKVVFWVWDYYPLKHSNSLVILIRWIYWQLDKIATFSDRVIYLNKRLIKIRKDNGLILPKNNRVIIPIGTDLYQGITRKPAKVRLGFLGVLKQDQGLDLLFDNTQELKDSFPNIEIEIIGPGPNEQYFRDRAKSSCVPYTFYGWVPEKKVEQILSRCTIGIAPYSPEESSVAYYGDPGKIKSYLSACLPIITTNVFDFSRELELSGAGIVIDYNNPKSLLKAIRDITDNYKRFTENVVKLNKRFY